MAKKEKVYTIYCHTSPSGKKYVGRTSKSIDKRWREHISYSTLCEGGAIHGAIRKYGQDSFIHEILETINSPEVAVECEIKWVKALNTKVPNGYNLTSGGEGVFEPSDETREKLSKSKKGKPLHPNSRAALKFGPLSRIGTKTSEETKALMSAAAKGKPKSLEHREALSKAKKGKSNGPRSEETKRKISEAQLGEKNHNWKKGRPHTEEAKRKISESNKGKRLGIKLSDETCRAMSVSRKGKPLHPNSATAFEKARADNKGKKRSVETRQAMSKSKLGKKRGSYKPRK